MSIDVFRTEYRSEEEQAAILAKLKAETALLEAQSKKELAVAAAVQHAASLIDVVRYRVETVDIGADAACALVDAATRLIKTLR